MCGVSLNFSKAGYDLYCQKFSSKHPLGSKKESLNNKIAEDYHLERDTDYSLQNV